jgi:hypothetical protein
MHVATCDRSRHNSRRFPRFRRATRDTHAWIIRLDLDHFVHFAHACPFTTELQLPSVESFNAFACALPDSAKTHRLHAPRAAASRPQDHASPASSVMGLSRTSELSMQSSRVRYMAPVRRAMSHACHTVTHTASFLWCFCVGAMIHELEGFSVNPPSPPVR